MSDALQSQSQWQSSDCGKRTRVAILGGGPAGLGAAYQLRRTGKAEVMLFERQNDVGGNAGSFEIDEIPVDYGSHRLHPACRPDILSDLQRLLGADLLSRPRNGRIRIRDRWIRFPLKPLDLLLRMPASFALGVASDCVSIGLNGKAPDGSASFASVLESGLGRTICNDFYFPYARKIWGLAPEQISPVQASRRVSANTMGKMLARIMRSVRKNDSNGSGMFYYPRNGYGQICRVLADQARGLGATIRLNATVRKLSTGAPHRLEIATDKGQATVEADHIWSTIPITVLAQMVDPRPPPAVVTQARQLDYRAMLLVYLTLQQSQFTPFDAHYFPEDHVALTRISEPKNYSGRTRPATRTILCCEIPCMRGDEMWQADDEKLAAVVLQSLARSSLAVNSKVTTVVTKRLPFAYPIYHHSYEQCFQQLDGWISELKNTLSFGRQGLFAHDNTHHALAMAYGAVDCLGESGEFNQTLWQRYRKEFDEHVVED